MGRVHRVGDADFGVGVALCGRARRASVPWGMRSSSRRRGVCAAANTSASVTSSITRPTWDVMISPRRRSTSGLGPSFAQHRLNSVGDLGSSDRLGRLRAPSALGRLAQSAQASKLLGVGPDHPRTTDLVELAAADPASTNPGIKRDGGHRELGGEIWQPPLICTQRRSRLGLLRRGRPHDVTTR